MKTSKDYVAEIYDLIGENFPLTVDVVFGKLISVEYSKEWKVGGTVLEDSGEVDEDGNAIMEYIGEYEDKKLTDEQVAKIDNWIKENVEV